MIGWLEKQAWKIASGVLLIMVISLGIQLARVAADRAKIEKQRAALELAIDKPVTGWRARMLTCTNNTAELKGAISAQNDRIKVLGEQSAARIAGAEQALVAAERGKAAADAKIKSLLRPLVGSDTCLRVIEADARLLESLR